MRSSGLPRSKALHAQTRVIRARATDVTVRRQTETTGSLDEVTTTESDHTERIWLFEPRESVAAELAGERIDGGLGGLIVSDGNVDVKHGDRVTYGAVEYEIDTIVGHPIDAEPGSAPDTSFWILSFERRQ